MIEDYHKIRPILRIGQHDAPPVTGKRGLDPEESRRRRITAGPDAGHSGGDAPVSLKVYGELTPLPLSATRDFTALVRVTQDQRVTWTTSVGTINANGIYVAPTEMPPDIWVTVRAESVIFPELFDEVRFPLSDTLQHLTLILHNSCGPVAANGTWSIRAGEVVTQVSLDTVPAGEAGSQVTTQIFNTEEVNLVQAQVVLTGVLYNGNSSVTLNATQTDDTTWEADLCEPPPEWTYFSTQQSYTAYCPSGTFGLPVTVTKAAGTYTSTESVAAANALTLAAAQSEAEAGLSCSTQTLRISADALDANGKIKLSFMAPGFRGNVDWTVTIGAVRRPDGSGGYIDPGNFIKPTELGTPYRAENLTYHTNIPDAAAVLDLVFYFETIDPRWLIGNSDGSTWLIDVTAQAVSTDPTPDVTLTQTWKKYLLI